MKDRRTLALTAATEALSLRQSLNVELQDAVCVYDAAATLGIEVRFVEQPSLEGMYLKEPKSHIFVSSLRPPGRQAYTCAHELGHHNFGHGSHILQPLDEILDQQGFTDDEYLADTFAGCFLMPRTAVSYAFAVRGWKPNEPTVSQVYTIAGWFGVGYTTLIHHMSRTLKLLPVPYAAKLTKYQPKQIRATLLGEDGSTGLVVVDRHWSSHPVDIRTGDHVLLPPQTIIEGNTNSLIRETEKGVLVRARKPGISRAYSSTSDWAIFIRVSRSAYVGRSIFRHLDDPEEE